MTTDRQKRAVRFCEKWLHIVFNGDIDNFNEVSVFLSKHLDNAFMREEEASYCCDCCD